MRREAANADPRAVSEHGHELEREQDHRTALATVVKCAQGQHPRLPRDGDVDAALRRLFESCAKWVSAPVPGASQHLAAASTGKTVTMTPRAQRTRRLRVITRAAFEQFIRTCDIVRHDASAGCDRTTAADQASGTELAARLEKLRLPAQPMAQPLTAAAAAIRPFFLSRVSPSALLP